MPSFAFNVMPRFINLAAGVKSDNHSSLLPSIENDDSGTGFCFI